MGSPVSLRDAPRLVIAKSNGDLSSTEEEEEDYALFSGEEEWCGENRFCFYFVKQFAYDDPEIRAKIDEADDEIYSCNSERIHISNRLKAKRAERLSMESLKDQEVSESLSEVKMEMELLEAQMSCVLDQRDRAFERIKFLRIQRDKGNAAFFQSRLVMKKAVELAASGNVRDLEELANSEVDKFMSRWNDDKAFRDDYKKRISPSLEERKLRRCVDSTEDRDETAIDEEEEESDEKLEKEEEEETLKEKKREEQLEKAQLAMERKRKLHEKAAARAAIRVKKEAEKKLKELEKRAKKKNKAASSPSDLERTPETATEASEPEKKEKLLNGRPVSWKQRSFFRYRQQKKGNETVPKVILKRRRAYRLWVWSVSSAAVALPLALLIVFFYVG